MIKNLFLGNHVSIANTLIYLFPVAILGRNTWSASILIGLTIIGLIASCQQKINPFRHETIRLVSTITCVYFCSIIIFSILSEKAFTTSNLSGGELFYLFAPFITLSIYRANINFDILILIIKLSLILLGIIVLYRSTKTIEISDRVLWVSHIGVMLLVFSWLNISKENKYSFLLTLISSTLALNAIILAGTRGPVLTFFAMSIVFLFLNSRYSHNKYRNKVFAVLLVFITTAILAINPISKHRFTAAVINIYTWASGTSASTREVVGSSSTAQRLEMYKAGIMAAKDKPILGYGYKNTTGPTSNFTQPGTKKYIQQHTHLHNTYVEALVYGGIVAFLVTIIFLLLLPLKKFTYAFKIRQNTKYAILGILFISGYALLGLTDTMTIGLYESGFYVFFISLLLPKTIEKL